MIEWVEDDFTPRVDELAKPLRWWSRSIPVAHPDWFFPGDIVRITTTGEAVFVRDGQRIARAVGSRKRAKAPARSEVLIIGNTKGTVRHLSYRRWWWRPFHIWLRPRQHRRLRSVILPD